jgi:hypothetical protein
MLLFTGFCPTLACTTPISIPQPEGPDIPIITHNVYTASKMLGVHFSPAGNLSFHVENMVQKGLDWVDCLKTKPVSRVNAWLSFFATSAGNIMGTSYGVYAP